MPKYNVTWGGMDNGGEGKWNPDVWLKTIEIISRHEGEAVYDENSPVYVELEAELPDLTWRSTDGQRFRPLFRDYPESDEFSNFHVYGSVCSCPYSWLDFTMERND